LGTGKGDIETTPGSPTRLADLARACGLDGHRVQVAEDANALRGMLARTRTEPGPWVFVAVTERSSTDQSGGRARTVLHDAVETVDLTRRYLREH
jgi:thiamine pyrophosphate-dependent acetolactate synthase large subunit-like protein